MYRKNSRSKDFEYLSDAYFEEGADVPYTDSLDRHDFYEFGYTGEASPMRFFMIRDKPAPAVFASSDVSSYYPLIKKRENPPSNFDTYLVDYTIDEIQEPMKNSKYEGYVCMSKDGTIYEVIANNKGQHTGEKIQAIRKDNPGISEKSSHPEFNG